jgi:hypothetical protein
LHWRRREAPERILINFEYELDEKHELVEEGSSREDVHQFIRIE